MSFKVFTQGGQVTLHNVRMFYQVVMVIILVIVISSLEFWKVGDTVLDPFMGSGTTLRVAHRLGRHSIGIELLAAYCDAAAAQIEKKHICKAKEPSTSRPFPPSKNRVCRSKNP